MVFCTYCGQSFTRDEHLERHILIHTSVRPFKCITCHMSFARRDLLQRHYTLHYNDKTNEESPPKFSSKFIGKPSRACSNCKQKRVKCNLGSPCKQCKRRDLQCTYSQNGTLSRVHTANTANDEELERKSVGTAVVLPRTQPEISPKETASKSAQIPFKMHQSDNDYGLSESDDSTSNREDAESFQLQDQRRKIVDRVMAYFNDILRVMPVGIHYTAHDDSKGTSSNHDKSSDLEKSQPSLSTMRGLISGKRRFPKEDGDEDDAEFPPSKQPRTGEPSSEALHRRGRFACPYFKRNPDRYIMRRSCVGPGWDEVRRVKYVIITLRHIVYGTNSLL